MPLNPLSIGEYQRGCDFTSLQTPNLRHIIEKELLSSSNEYNGYKDKWSLVDNANVLLSVDSWSSFVDELVSGIKGCLGVPIEGIAKTRQNRIMKVMQRDLAKEEERIISSFTMPYANNFIDNMDVNISQRYLLLGSWRRTMWVISRAVIDLVKHDTCSNASVLLWRLRIKFIQYLSMMMFGLYTTTMKCCSQYITLPSGTSLLASRLARNGRANLER